MSDLYQNFLNLKIPASGLASTEFALIMQNDPQAIMSREELENMAREKSWNERAYNVFSQGCNTYSKRDTSYVRPSYPTHVVSSDGLKIKCSDGKEYYDCGGLGSQLIDSSNNFSLPHYREVELAEKIQAIIPICGRMKFLKTGSAATECALRFARAVQGKRTGVVWSGYHGVGNPWISCESPGLGTVYENSVKFTDDNKLLEFLSSSPKAKNMGTLCMEPVLLDDSDARRHLVKTIIRVARERHMTIIMDEIVTGFRTRDYCYTNHWNLDCDIITFGKGMANGRPLAVCGGKESTMNRDGVFISNTTNGELSAIEEALTVIDLVTPAKLDEFCGNCMMAKEQFNKGSCPVKLIGTDTRWTWATYNGLTGYSMETKVEIAKFWEQMLEEGFLCSISMFPKMNWVPCILEEFVAASKRVQSRFQDCTLKGTPSKPVFERYQKKGKS